jgi:hypothetical protein
VGGAGAAKPVSVDRLYRLARLFLDQPFGQRDDLLPMAAVAQFEEAAHEPQSANRRLVDLQCCKLRRHLDQIHCCHSGLNAVTKPSLDKIIEQLQFCIVDARALQLKMLERILSIALLEAYEIKDKFSKDTDDSSF